MDKLLGELQYHWLWQDKPFAKGQAWIDLLLCSSKSQTKTIFRNKFHKVEPGQIITSENELCNRWGWSRTKLRSFLQLIEQASMVELFRDKTKTLITILQYPIELKTVESKNHQEKPAQLQVIEQDKRQVEKQLKPAQKQAIAPTIKQAKKQVKEQDKNTSDAISFSNQTFEPYQLTIMDEIERGQLGEKQ